MALMAARILVLFVTLVGLADAKSNLLRSQQVSKETLDKTLLAELATKPSPENEARLKAIKAELRDMYTCLPKNSYGRLDHSVVRYALHRLLVDRHGWFIKGLEPGSDGWKTDANHMDSVKEWVPSYLQEVMERRAENKKGFGLAELAVLAATLEDLVHRESTTRLETIYKVMGIPDGSSLKGEQADNVIDIFLMVYIMGGEFSATNAQEAMLRLGTFKRKYEGWREVDKWARELQHNISMTKTMDPAMANKVAESIGLQFGNFNDRECRDLKQTLLGIEDRKKKGRVRLSQFYKMGLHTHWSFTEKVDYLRTLGALDESDKERPLVIVPNYLASRPQCLEASSFYAVCCRNECEDLMSHLEHDIAAPLADPDRIIELVSNLASDTVTAPRTLPETLIKRLRKMAEDHDGMIHLHGRLFAQWMHHAFPRECVYPHEEGTTSPQTPDEWMKSTGQQSTQETEDEMVARASEADDDAVEDATAMLIDESSELPWSDNEQLLVDPPSHRALAPSPPLKPAETMPPTPPRIQSAFTKAGQVSKEEAEKRLLAEFVANRRPGAQAERLAEIKALLRPMYVALPKNMDGRLDHSVVRYALHRLLVEQHGWYIKGLEPNGAAWNATSPMDGVKEWVPSYLQAFLERSTGGHGFGLTELVVMAATLEDLVHGEAIGRLQALYDVMGISNTSTVEGLQADQLIDMYLMIFLIGGEFIAKSPDEALLRLGSFKKKYTGWKQVDKWARDVQNNVAKPSSRLDFTATSKIAEAIGTQFAEFNDVECKELKDTLLSIEDTRHGRVKLSTFYKKGLYTHWQFTEKVDYLRTLGAIDESDPSRVSVIIPNYVASRPQCLEASDFYAVCCRNECEDLMAQLEQAFAEPMATPERIVEVVSTLSSGTVKAPRDLSEGLKSRLNRIAEIHAGLIPLHGRLFAQWMHHAYPRECPYPHLAGTTQPQTPDEWLRSSGQGSSTATEDEMMCHVNGPCSKGVESSADTVVDPSLPWSDAEELLVSFPSQRELSEL